MSDPETWAREHREAHANGSPERPPDIDITVPSVARVYDYILEGKNYFAIDCDVAHGLEATFPGITRLAIDNRRFLQRGVRYLAQSGIRQFLDIGSGLPTAGNVHEIAQQVDPQARVVYVDIDPIVLAHGRALLADDNTTTVIRADAADPASILDHPQTRRFIDFDQPYAVLLAGLLHWLSDEQDPAGVTRLFTERMPPGGYLLASVLLDDDDPRARRIQDVLGQQLRVGWFRPWEQHREYFAGLDLVEPGLVYANDWRPDEETHRYSPWHTFLTGGIGRKPS
jgi:hypothetical protein